MLIKSITLKNFRSYRNEVTVSFDKLTTLIGRNDVGKSTILEALDIFFNDGSGAAKLDKDDLNKEALSDGETDIMIAVEFCDLPTEIIIDESNSTTLADEYLLNTNENLTVVKYYPNAGKAKVYIKANHPTNPECANLLLLKQKELKKKVEDLQLECDKTRNAKMRRAIWNYYANNLSLSEIDIEIGVEGIKDIYPKLNLYFPLYSLFQSDRSNSDKDKEAQDPMKEAVRLIMNSEDIKSECQTIAQKVTEELHRVTAATLDKLREMNAEMADSLEARIPSVEDLKWTDVFKSVSLTDQNGISLNKRGSGVKRLVLLNFFRAQAEKSRVERNHPSVIYAIEEPETSQHISHQELMINSLMNLASNQNVQVLLTTHSSLIVKKVGNPCLRLVHDVEGERRVDIVEPNLLPYASLNEINYVVFGDLSVEYHNELYGFLQSKAIEEDQKYEKEVHFEQWLKDKGLHQDKQWKRERGGVAQSPQPATLCTYVRNSIHHPENNSNDNYTREELAKSILFMRTLVQMLNPA
jgi:predicted ATP-dependent endonuclease of OLD family